MGPSAPLGQGNLLLRVAPAERSRLGLVELWKPQDVKPASVAPDNQEDRLDEGAGSLAPVMEEDEKVSQTLLGVASGAEQVVGPSDLMTLQDSVESWF
jgi:hypothetical protein